MKSTFILFMCLLFVVSAQAQQITSPKKTKQLPEGLAKTSKTRTPKPISVQPSNSEKRAEEIDKTSLVAGVKCINIMDYAKLSVAERITLEDEGVLVYNQKPTALDYEAYWAVKENKDISGADEALLQRVDEIKIRQWRNTNKLYSTSQSRYDTMTAAEKAKISKMENVVIYTGKWLTWNDVEAMVANKK